MLLENHVGEKVWALSTEVCNSQTGYGSSKRVRTPSTIVCHRTHVAILYQVVYMNGMGSCYIPWETLDCNEHYCLADTMGLVDLHRGTLDAMHDVRKALGGRTMLVILDVVEEAAIKCMELGDTPRMTLDEFEDAVVTSLDKSGLPFALVRLPDGVVSAADKQCAKKEYPNKQGDPLSFVDCMLLCGAMNRANVDVMTADGELTEAMLVKCGIGRTCSPRIHYYKRRNATARFVTKLLGADVKRIEAGTRLEYTSEDGPVIILDTSKAEAAVMVCTIGGKLDASEAVRTFFMISIRAAQCQCRADKGKPFRCSCPDFPYSPDSGLEKEEAFKFLDSLPPRERDKLYSLVKSF